MVVQLGRYDGIELVAVCTALLLCVARECMQVLRVPARHRRRAFPQEVGAERIFDGGRGRLTLQLESPADDLPKMINRERS